MKQIALLCFLNIFSGIFISCDSYNAPKQLEFYYYPAKNVYYNVAAKEYYFSLDGGTTWDSVNALTNKEPATLGAKQVLYNTTPDIWTNNRMHIQQYNGEVINISTGDSVETNSKPVADRKVKKSKLPSNTQTAQPEKKRSFFQRLFGKKNKD